MLIITMLFDNIFFYALMLLQHQSILQYTLHYTEKRYHWEQYLCRTQWPLHIRGHSHQEQIGEAKQPDTNGVTRSRCHSDVMSIILISSLHYPLLVWTQPNKKIT